MLILVRYGEIGLKSKSVRRRFEKKLINNIEDAFLRNKIECSVTSDWGRIYVYTESVDKVVNVLKNIFGIVSVSSVVETSSKLDDICALAVDYSKKIIKKNQSFAVRSRRTGTHPYSSMDVAVKVGSAILNAVKGVSVNLNNPDVEIFVEVRNNKAYIFSKKIRGPGGMPLGTQGRVAAFINDKKSVVAAWLLMKRGCSVVPIYKNSNNNKSYYTKILNQWNNLSKPFLLESDDVFNSTELSGILLKGRFKGVVFGLTYDELRKYPIKTKLKVSLFFPLIGMRNSDIKNLWKKIIFEQLPI